MKRLYEWRYEDNGALYGKPRLAENACTFTLDAMANRGIRRGGEAPDRTPGRNVSVVVSSTGERVKTEEKLTEGIARLANDPDAAWYFVDGRMKA